MYMSWYCTSGIGYMFEPSIIFFMWIDVFGHYFVFFKFGYFDCLVCTLYYITGIIIYLYIFILGIIIISRKVVRSIFIVCSKYY